MSGEPTHAMLCRLAERWLWRQGCGVVFRDTFRAITSNGEVPDAIGWRHAVSILVECKTSRADFHADRSKPHRCGERQAVGDWRFFLCPEGLIKPPDLPAGWGLLYAGSRGVTAVQGVPGNCGWRSEMPFSGAKVIELEMMYSALRRMVRRGHFNAIYDPLPVEGAPNG